MRRRNPSSTFTSSIRRRRNTHSTQVRAEPTATNDATILMTCRGVSGQARTARMAPVTSTPTKNRQLAELVDVVVESRRRAKGVRVGACELEEHFRDHHTQPHTE